jgi:hypothetical protein
MFSVSACWKPIATRCKYVTYRAKLQHRDIVKETPTTEMGTARKYVTQKNRTWFESRS